MPDHPPPAPAAGFALAVGGANLDVLGRRTAEGACADSVPGVIEQAPGGVARNVAENLARLGRTVRLVTRVGEDAAGEWLLRHTGEAGVDTGAVLRSARLPSARYLAVHDAAGGLLAAVSDMRTLDALDPGALAAIAPLIAGSHLLLVDANLPEATLGWLLEQATVPVFADATSAAKAPRLRSVRTRLHTLKLNLPEARALAGRPGADWRDCATVLIEAGVQRVVVGLGAAGLGYADATRVVTRPALACEVRNEAGAGDALCAGLAAAWLRGLSLVAQLDYARACAALTLGSPLANDPGLSHARVERLLAR